MVRDGEIIELPAAQFRPDRPAVGGAMQIQAQQLRLGPFAQASLTGLLPALRAAMPALAFHLLA